MTDRREKLKSKKQWFLVLIIASFMIFNACGYYTDTYNDEDSDKSSDDDDSGNQDDDDDAGGGGNKIDNFTWTTVDNESLTLYDYEGSVVLLSVGAGWCVECKDETPILEKQFWQVYKDQGLVVIQLLIQNATGKAADIDFATEWKNEFGVTFPLCIDPDNSTEPYWDQPSLPFIMLLNKKLEIEDKSHGFDKEVYKLLVEQLL